MKIAIIGCGNMGGGLAQRLSQTNQLFLYDHHVENAERLESFGKVCKDVMEAVKAAEMIILAIKPQNLKTGLFDVGHKLLVSLLAGTSLKTLRQYFPKSRLVRMMPNLPLVYGEGVIGLCADEREENLTRIFEPLGKVYWFTEDKIDALTALGGSGPAFFFAIVEAMVDAGIAMGFTAKESQGIVHQMLQGSLTLLEKTGQHPGELKWRVASPKGTTIAGIKRLEELALRGTIINTFLAAHDRAKEL